MREGAHLFRARVNGIMTPWRWIDSLATTTAVSPDTPGGNQSCFSADKYACTGRHLHRHRATDNLES